MNEFKSYNYSSIFSKFFDEFVKLKREMGYKYESEAAIYKDLDNYFVANDITDLNLTKEMLESWLHIRQTESKSYQHKRISAYRQFAFYMCSLGYICYIPKNLPNREKPVIHIITEEELAQFFEAVDKYSKLTSYYVYPRREFMLPALFRLIYCCGLRSSEACFLKRDHIDFEKKTILIKGSKKDKDRLIYLPDDLNEYLFDYWEKVKEIEGLEPEWFFPNEYGHTPLYRTAVCYYFNYFWSRTEASKHCSKKPSPHSLRHCFVINRINLWTQEGLDLNKMMPYLSKHLGHSDRQGTYYYYHSVQNALKTIKEKDKTSSLVIPEVETL